MRATANVVIYKEVSHLQLHDICSNTRMTRFIAREWGLFLFMVRRVAVLASFSDVVMMYSGILLPLFVELAESARSAQRSAHIS